MYVLGVLEYETIFFMIVFFTFTYIYYFYPICAIESRYLCILFIRYIQSLADVASDVLQSMDQRIQPIALYFSPHFLHSQKVAAGRRKFIYLHSSATSGHRRRPVEYMAHMCSAVCMQLSPIVGYFDATS